MPNSGDQESRVPREALPDNLLLRRRVPIDKEIFEPGIRIFPAAYPKSTPKRELSYSPVLLRRAKLKRRHKNTDILEFFRVKDEGTVSRWLRGVTNMKPDHAKMYDLYIDVLTDEERKA